MKNIQKAAMAVCLAGILFSGCGSLLRCNKNLSSFIHALTKSLSILL